MKTKKILFLAISIIVLIIIVFLIFNYKNQKTGNTIINKSDEQIVQDILNISSYEAKLEIEVQSNKNTNKYIVKQRVKENKEATQEILEPENIAGIITKYDGQKITINNSKLELTKIYENYNYMVENSLWLNSFIDEYKKYNETGKNTKIKQENNQIILEITNEGGNKYNLYKKLYIDKKTGKPIKLIVEDINQKTLVYILYTEIKIS